MKKLALALGVATSLSAGAAHAQYGMAGCGLGSLLFGNDNSPLSQILAATTNVVLPFQFFGITSGTSNCLEGGIVKAEREQAAFAEVNFQDLKRNMAAGGGEYLASFSALLGCEEAARATLAETAQDRYEAIFPTTTTTPMEMLTAVKTEIRANAGLAGACSDERAIARAQGRPMQVATR